MSWPRRFIIAGCVAALLVLFVIADRSPRVEGNSTPPVIYQEERP